LSVDQYKAYRAQNRAHDLMVSASCDVRCAFFDRGLHSRMPLNGIPLVSTFLTGAHCKLRPNTKDNRDCRPVAGRLTMNSATALTPHNTKGNSTDMVLAFVQLFASVDQPFCA
jgi:hypothetical protein